MPNRFIVTDQPDLSALTEAVLRSRTSAATRTSAMEAIRLANPHLDFERLLPGAVVVIPEVPGVRPGAVSDPVAEVADDLLVRVREGLSLLGVGAETAEATRRQEQDETLQVLDSEDVRRMLRSDRLLGRNVETVRAGLEQDNVEAKRDRAEMRAAFEGWSNDLDQLRSLLQ